MENVCIVFNIPIQRPAKLKDRDDALKQKTEDTIMCRMAYTLAPLGCVDGSNRRV